MLLCLAVACPKGQATAGDALPVKRPKASVQAQGFELEGLDGRLHRLDEFKGSVILLHFFASWCDPCKKEFPSIKAVHERLGKSGLEIVAVSEDNVERTARFIESQGTRFTVLIDRYGGVMRAYKVSVIPSTVIISRDGLISGVVAGPLDWDSKAVDVYVNGLLNR